MPYLERDKQDRTHTVILRVAPTTIKRFWIHEDTGRLLGGYIRIGGPRDDNTDSTGR